MQKGKRVIITIILGLIFGCVSWVICNYAMGHKQPLSINLMMILTNGLLGFCIGISSLRWPWAVHGLVLGGLFGVIMGLVAVAQGSQFIWPLIFGLAYGFLIELIATVAFKAGIRIPEASQATREEPGEEKSKTQRAKDKARRPPRLQTLPIKTKSFPKSIARSGDEIRGF